MQQEKFKFFEIINNFLEETNMQWDHGQWLELLSRMERTGFIINPDMLGRMIEMERERKMKGK